MSAPFTFDWTAALADVPRPDAACEQSGRAAILARSAQNERLIRALYAIVEGDWRMMARVVIAQGYYLDGADVGNVATTLRNLGVKLGFAKRWKSRHPAWTGKAMRNGDPRWDLAA